MTLTGIRQMPTAVVSGSNPAHESLLRSYHIVEKVKELLAAETPHCVIAEIIDHLMDGPHETLTNPPTRD